MESPLSGSGVDKVKLDSCRASLQLKHGDSPHQYSNNYGPPWKWQVSRSSQLLKYSGFSLCTWDCRKGEPRSERKGGGGSVSYQFLTSPLSNLLYLQQLLRHPCLFQRRVSTTACVKKADSGSILFWSNENSRIGQDFPFIQHLLPDDIGSIYKLQISITDSAVMLSPKG